MTVQGPGRFDWERVVMMAALPPMTKLVALGLATFANRAGTNAHPGNERLARELGLSARTVERHLDSLRTIGLVERTFRGSAAGRRRMADVYRLVVADDVHERVDFIGSPDTSDGSSPVDNDGTPDTGDGSSEQEHPTRETEHPTAATGTPDTSDGTPDTGVAPPCIYTTEEHQEVTPSFGGSTTGAASPPDDDKHQQELAMIKGLPTAKLEQLLAQATDAVGNADWPAIVHYAAEHIDRAVSA